MSDIKNQKIFVDKVMDKTKALKQEKKPIALYKELVFHRFYEVLSNANPIFFSMVKEKEFDKMVKKFILYGAKTDLIWQLPNEFRRFVKKEKKWAQKMPYLSDLLWFEWIEIKLFMQDYKSLKISKLNFKKRYKCSKSTKLKQLLFKVYERDFENQGEYFVLAYYDLEDLEVKYREISAFMYDFLNRINHGTLMEVIHSICKKYDLDKKEIKEVLKEPLEELCALGVIQIKGKK